MMTLPRRVQWALERLLDPVAAEAISGDLTEEYAARRAAGCARWRLGAWLSWQVVLAIASRTRSPRHDNGSRRTMLETLWTDVRYACRTLRRSPGFTLGAVVPLSLAIALAAAVFAVVHAVLLRDLPFDRGDELVVVGEHDPGAPIATLGYETWIDLRERAASFAATAAVGSWSPTLTSPATMRLAGMRVTSGFFSMIGVTPALGRDFEPADDTPQTRRVAMLSDGLWRRQFGADPDIIGRVFQLNETDYRVVGVLPADFEPIVSAHFYAPAEIWTPLGYAIGGPSSCRSCRHLRAVARLAPGATPAAAAEEIRALHAGLAAQFPREYGSEAIGVESLGDRIARPTRQPLVLLLVAVLLVLAVAATNGASLMLARASDTEHEWRLRSALGASTMHLVRRRLIEAGVLAMAALGGGLGLAQLTIARVVSQIPESLPRADRIGLNADVVLTAAAATVALCGAMIVLPGLRVRGSLPLPAARTRATDGRARVRLRETLIVADVAMALMLGIGAGLMFRSLDRLLAVDPGFDAANVHTLGLSLVGPRWAEDAAVRAFQDALLAQAQAIPGVKALALTGQVPLGGSYDRRGGFLEERQTNRAEDMVEFERYSITPGYLDVMGIPLRRGRPLADADRLDALRVMLINETAARTFWPGQDPVGRRATFDREGTLTTIVGVIGDVRHYGLDEPAAPQMYLPQAQVTDSYLVMVLRTDPRSDVLPRVREIVRGLSPDVPIYQVRPMAQLVSEAAASRRFTALLLGLFAMSAVAVTAVGLYGVVAYMVSRRTREFGIRLALGAPVSGIRRLVIARGLLLVGLGAVGGLIGSLGLTRLLQEQLFQTSPLDPVAIGLGIAGLAFVTAAAHVVPVARATRVSPTVALRTD
jgi:putative ABC transport system permease protein